MRLRDFARWASLFLNRGKNLSGEQIVPAEFIEDIVIPRQEIRDAWQRGDYATLFPHGHYRNQTYVMDAKCSQLAMLGIHGQFAFIDLERDLLMVGYGSYPSQVGPIMFAAMMSFWQGVLESLPG